MKRVRLGLIIATSCLCACGPSPAPLDRAAEQYVHLALAVAARDPDSLDFYAGDPAWRADAEREYRPLADVRRDVSALHADLMAAADGGSRRQFLVGQVDALATRIDILRGERLPVADEAKRLFGFALVDDDPPVDGILAALNRELPGDGDLLARYIAYREPQVLRPDRVRPVFEAALAACRERTIAHIPLPGDERITVDYASSQKPWSAFTRYAGAHRSTIEVNLAFAFTSQDLRDLACHEGYPGHHTAYVLQDDEFVRRQHRIEFTIEPLFSPQSMLSESAATYAPALAFPTGGDDVASWMARLDARRLKIAREYLDGHLEFARAATALESETLMPSAGATLKFLNEFRSYVVTYTAGRARVARIVEAAGAGDARWAVYRKLLLAGTLP